VDKVDGQIEVQQTPERLTGHPTRDNLAPDHDLIDSGVANILEDSLQGGEVPMDIIKRCDSHHRQFAIVHDHL
jgi:hypothetical protein